VRPGTLLPAGFALLLTTVAFLTTHAHTHVRGYDTDGAIYGAMAGSTLFDPAIARQAPYAYRVVTPRLAALLPWATLDNFRVLAFVSNVLSLWILFDILSRLGCSRGLSALGVLLYAGVFWTLRFSFFSPAYVDYQTQLFLLLVIWLSVSERYLALLPLLAIAPLQKESLAAYALFPAVHFMTTRARGITLSSGLLLASFLVLPAAALAGARLFIPVDNSHDVLSVPATEISRLADPGSWLVLLQALFSGLGVLPLILVVRYGDSLAFLKSHPEWMVYLTISAAFLFGGEDRARLFLYGLPLLVLLTVRVVGELRAADNRRRFLAWAFAAVALHLFLGGHFTPVTSFDHYLAAMVPEHSTGQYLPFLARNSVLALVFLALSGWFVVAEWSFAPASGFTRRRRASGTAPVTGPGAARR
jgi:hypothetical protein